MSPDSEKGHPHFPHRIWKFLLLCIFFKQAWDAYWVHPPLHSSYSTTVAFVGFFLLMGMWIVLGLGLFFGDRLPGKAILPMAWVWLAAGCFLWWFVDDSPFSGYPSYIDRAVKIQFFSLVTMGFPLAFLIYLGRPPASETQKPVIPLWRLAILASLLVSGLWLLLVFFLEGDNWQLLSYPLTATGLALAFLAYFDLKKSVSPARPAVSLSNPPTSPPLRWWVGLGWFLSGLWLTAGILFVAAWTASEDNLREIRNAVPEPWWTFLGRASLFLIVPLALFQLFNGLKKGKEPSNS